MLKLLGIIIIGACSVYGAYFSIIKNTKKTEYHEELLRYIEFIRMCIVNYRMPLYEIESMYDGKKKFKIINHFESCDKDCEFREYLDKDSQKAVISFSSIIGKVPLEDEKRECDILIDLLRKKTDSAKENLPKMNKIESSLFVLGGIGLIITVL